MWLEDNYIYSTPSNSDLGTATVTVTASDTGSTAQASTEFVATVEEKAELTGITVTTNAILPVQTQENINVYTTGTLTADISVTKNAVVKTVEYELINAPAWINVGSNGQITIQPTDNTRNQDFYCTVKATGYGKDRNNNATIETPMHVKSVYAHLGGLTVSANPTTLKKELLRWVTFTITASRPITSVNSISGYTRYVYIEDDYRDRQNTSISNNTVTAYRLVRTPIPGTAGTLPVSVVLNDGLISGTTEINFEGSG